MKESGDGRPPFAVHVDVDGLSDICRVHGWPDCGGGDPVFETGLPAVLALCERFGVRATLFVIADTLLEGGKREMLEEAVRQGHEIASHSFDHKLLHGLTRSEKWRQIGDSRRRLEDVLGVPVQGFRAPGYRIDAECITVLAEAGYRWDASAFATAKYARWLGLPDDALKGGPVALAGGALLELPLQDYRPLPFPFTPSYTLLMGLWYYRLGLLRAVRSGQPFMLLFHLIDLADPVPRERLGRLSQRVYTLSVMDGVVKRERCARMIELAAQRFTLSDMRQVLSWCAAHGDMRSTRDHQ